MAPQLLALHECGGAVQRQLFFNVHSGRGVAQLVARLHGVQEVRGSSPRTPTRGDRCKPAPYLSPAIQRDTLREWHGEVGSSSLPTPDQSTDQYQESLRKKCIMKILIVCSYGRNRSKYLAEYLKGRGYQTDFAGISIKAEILISQKS